MFDLNLYPPVQVGNVELTIYSKSSFKKAFPSANKKNVPAALSLKLDKDKDFREQATLLTQNLSILQSPENIEVIQDERKKSITILSPNLSKTLLEITSEVKKSEILGDDYWADFQTVVAVGWGSLERLNNEKSFFSFIFGK